jgi:hypothetical protein
MRKMGGSFIEQHIEKVALGLAVVVFVGIVGYAVVLNLNAIKYDNKKFRLSEIDPYISRQAETLNERLNGQAKPKEAYRPKSSEFLALMNLGVKGVDFNLVLPLPVSVKASVVKKYRVPQVGDVTNVAVEHIRAAAYAPMEAVTAQNYNQAETYEPNDIDLVTVEGEFDAVALGASFEECFAGSTVNEQWRDPCLAKPIFAAVELQRQQLQADGSWSSWALVPRVRVEPQKDLFEVVEDAERLPPGGITVRLLKFSDSSVQASLLQPEAYQIASADEQWFPPALHKKYSQRQKEMELQEKREARAAEAAGKEEQRQQGREERTRSERRTKTTASAPTSGGLAEQQAYMQMLYGVSPGGGSTGAPGRTQPRTSRTERRAERVEKSAKTAKTVTDADIYDDFDKMSLANKADLLQGKEPIVLWAHDDTVEPRQTYRYRIRVGVFNPIAGTDQLYEQDLAYKNKAILWGAFSGVTEPVSIPSRIYFFPVDVREAAKGADVQVSRYALGYWYSEQFRVKRGETIGRAAEPKAEQKEDGAKIPAKVDYTTGAVMVDLVPVNDWTGTGSLYERHYYDILYSFDGSTVERVPAKLAYWPEELRLRYTEVRNLEKKTRLSFKAWGAATGRRLPLPGRGVPSPSGQPGGADMLEYQRMMMQQLQGGR